MTTRGICGSSGDSTGKSDKAAFGGGDVFSKYGGISRISSMITQIFKVTAAVDSGKMTKEEGYNLLKRSGIGDDELTELIELVTSLRD